MNHEANVMTVVRSRFSNTTGRRGRLRHVLPGLDPRV
jgi:hypothetical protein